jgi:hypothetical protein
MLTTAGRYSHSRFSTDKLFLLVHKTMASVCDTTIEEMIFLDLSSAEELTKIRDSAEFEKFISESASHSTVPPRNSVNNNTIVEIEIDVTLEHFSLTFKGLTLLFTMSQVKDIIFAGKPPTEEAARRYVTANPSLVKGIQYIYHLVQVRNQKMREWDELDPENEDLERRNENLDALSGHISEENLTLKRTICHEEGFVVYTDDAVNEDKQKAWLRSLARSAMGVLGATLKNGGKENEGHGE